MNQEDLLKRGRTAAAADELETLSCRIKNNLKNVKYALFEYDGIDKLDVEGAILILQQIKADTKRRKVILAELAKNE